MYGISGISFVVIVLGLSAAAPVSAATMDRMAGSFGGANGPERAVASAARLRPASDAWLLGSVDVCGCAPCMEAQASMEAPSAPGGAARMAAPRARSMAAPWAWRGAGGAAANPAGGSGGGAPALPIGPDGRPPADFFAGGQVYPGMNGVGPAHGALPHPFPLPWQFLYPHPAELAEADDQKAGDPDAAAISSVPLPASLPLALVGFGLLGLAGRFARKSHR